MTNPSRPTPNAESLSEADYEELDRFLCSDITSDEVMMIDTLDGYLTAIALGPTTLGMDAWLPGIWGPRPEDEPDFTGDAQAERIVELIRRQMNGIVWGLEADPDAYEPILDTVTYEDKSKEYLDGEMWCYGFMAGVALTREAWQPLFEDQDAIQALLPIYLLGADDVTPKQKALTKTPAQREKLAEQIASSVAKLHRFWAPYRQAMRERLVATTIERTQPKVGRNDPCPCGSGIKFKKCCGAASVLH